MQSTQQTPQNERLSSEQLRRQKIREQRRRQQKQQAWFYRGLALVCLVAVAVVVVAVFHKEPSKTSTQASENPSETQASSDPAATEYWAAGDMQAVMANADMARGNLVLVNRQYGYDAATAPELVNLYENKSEHYYLRSQDTMLSKPVVLALNDWMEAFYNYSHEMVLNVVAGYRTEEYQKDLRDNAIEEHGQKYADQYLALPGHSEHHTGLVIDLDSYDISSGSSGGFDGQGIFEWVVDHAWEYGFVQRYPLSKESITGINYEEWHFRYVGLPHSKIMTDENLCLEEYVDYLKNYPYSGQHLSYSCKDHTYEIYYCAGKNIALPKDKPYEISGNNVDGFIITVTIS